MKVSDVMNKVFVIDSDITLKQAATIMSQKRVGCLTFLKDNKIKGIITERDILKNISNLENNVSFIMTKKVITIDVDSEFEKVISAMAAHKIKKILITDEEKLVGIITSTDVISNSDLLREDIFS